MVPPAGPHNADRNGASPEWGTQEQTNMAKMTPQEKQAKIDARKAAAKVARETQRAALEAMSPEQRKEARKARRMAIAVKRATALVAKKGLTNAAEALPETMHDLAAALLKQRVNAAQIKRAEEQMAAWKKAVTEAEAEIATHTQTLTDAQDAVAAAVRDAVKKALAAKAKAKGVKTIPSSETPTF